MLFKFLLLLLIVYFNLIIETVSQKPVFISEQHFLSVQPVNFHDSQTVTHDLLKLSANHMHSASIIQAGKFSQLALLARAAHSTE